MPGCLIGAAVLLALLGLAALRVQPRHLRHLGPGPLLRGCAALVLLLLAASLVGLALLVARWAG